MADLAPRLLFLPVSGAYGMGEYARSLAIAHGVRARWPEASVRFMLSRAAPYAAGTPYPCTLLDASPTFHSRAVIDVVQSFRPDLVIFDNAGRSAQLRAARRVGAGVIFISSRARQRRRAFRLSWMRLIDEHWIAYPEFIAGELQPLERLKLKFMRRPTVRYLDVILARSASASASASPSPSAGVGACVGVAAGYVLLVPGGGTGHPGAADAVAQFLAAARSLAAAGIDTVLVGGGPQAPADAVAHLRVCGSLAQAELAELMRGARLMVANGGSTLLQAIACGRACVAVAIAGDQAERIRRCVRLGVALAAPLDADAMVRRVQELLCDAAALQALSTRAAALGLNDGVAVAVAAMGALLRSPAPVFAA